MKTRPSAPSNAPSESADCAIPWDVAAASIRAAAIVVTRTDDTIAACNDGARSLFGYREAEIVGKPISVLVAPCHLSEHAEAEAEVAGLFGRDTTTEWYRHKSGRRLFCTVSISCLTQADRPGWRAWLICDTTGVRERLISLDRRLSEQKEKRDKALNADESKDRCLALISHELKQPLTTVLLGVERLLDLTAGMDIQRVSEDLHTIRRATRRQARIVDDLLDISRIKTGKVRLDTVLVDVGDLTSHVVNAISEAAPDRIRVRLDVATTHLCFVDPVRLEQIVSNLLDNAIKFSGPFGLIEVRVEAIEDFAIISVADDGIGISQEFLPRIFRLFDQEGRGRSSAVGGLGIGLSLVQELARAHGGRVMAESGGPGRGSKFTVWLPLAR